MVGSEQELAFKQLFKFLELLGHKPENLEFEYRTQSGGKIDIFIKVKTKLKKKRF